jgi:hypothetical protein
MIYLKEGLQVMKRVKVDTQGIRVIMEGARKALVMKGKRLLEEVEFEDGDDLVSSIETLKEAYSGPIEFSNPSGRYVDFDKELASSKKASPGNPKGFSSSDAVSDSKVEEVIADLSDMGSEKLGFMLWDSKTKVLTFRGSSGSTPSYIKGVVSYTAALDAISRVLPGIAWVSVARLNQDLLRIKVKN